MTRDEADELLAQAIRQHADAYGMSEPDEMLASYALIAHWQVIEDDGRSRYTMAFDRPSVPDHIARGLFSTGVALLDSDEED